MNVVVRCDGCFWLNFSVMFIVGNGGKCGLLWMIVRLVGMVVCVIIVNVCFECISVISLVRLLFVYVMW